MKFLNTYISLGNQFFEIIKPGPAKEPKLLFWNKALANDLKIAPDLQKDQNMLAQYFSGGQLLDGSEPIAMAYAGHQFGNFVPQLGDGRAHLLGEVIDTTGKRKDIQLKGSGKTKYSRRGDGRCAIKPAIREFIMSEAMYALGIPTSRSLAVVTTGTPVFRENVVPGAIVTRVASSHIRIGTFQYFAARQNHEALQQLADYTIKRHYPKLDKEPNCYILLLEEVIEKQIQLVNQWMRVGFIHGVMNTDNITLSGETIDYGPCAMMGVYNPLTVYSSIDTMGRYAFGRQPEIMQWNMARLAECFLPLIDEDIDQAIKTVEPILATFPIKFKKAHLNMMASKLGFSSLNPEDQSLIDTLLGLLEEKELDYTITFNSLTKALRSETIAQQTENILGEWIKQWQQRINKQAGAIKTAESIMKQNNPVVIPRNHHVEAVLQECEQTGTTKAAKQLLEILRTPYLETDNTKKYQDPPQDGDKNYRTFCGT